MCCFKYFQVSDDIDLEELAQKTEGFSGSDLRELCRNAMIYRVRDYVRSEQLKLQFNAISNSRLVVFSCTICGHGMCIKCSSLFTSQFKIYSFVNPNYIPKSHWKNLLLCHWCLQDNYLIYLSFLCESKIW